MTIADLKFPPRNELLTDVPFGFTAGDDFTRTLTAKKNGAPFDVSGSTFTAQIRPRAGSSTLTATFTVDMTDAATGKVVLSLDHTVTVAIPRGVYRWDVDRVDANGDHRRVLAGHLIVEAAVTVAA